MRRASMSSTSGSRTTTPRLDAEEHPGVARKSSTASDTSDKKRKKLAAGTTKSRPRGESRSVTPETPSPLAKESTPPSAGAATP
jgi:hypothetical protein